MSAVPALAPMGMLVAALAAAAAGMWRPGVARAIAIAATAATTVVGAATLAYVLRNGVLRHEVGGWPAPIGIELVVDPLSALMVVLIGAVGLAAVVYPPVTGFGAAGVQRGVPVHGLVLLLCTGMLGVVVTGDLFNLFVFLEVYSLATYGLIALGGARAAFASLRYLVFATVAAGFYLLAVGFVYFMTGTLNMADAAARLATLGGSPTVVAAAVLATVGLGVKMALFPLHVWLPAAHSEAPPAVAALLAAVQVKVGAYALARVLLGVFDAPRMLPDVPLTTALVWFGMAAILAGSVWAARQDDLKRMLAYSTVAQIGYIGVGIGLATPLALAAALLHLVNHALAKAALFFVAGGILEQAGTKDLRRFGGMGARMPVTMGAFTLAAAAIAGLPPTAGFFAKWYLALAGLQEGLWLLAAAILGSSLLTVAYFLRVLERAFGPGEAADPAPGEPARAGAPGEPAVGALGEPAVGVLGEPAVSVLGEPAVGVLGEPAVGVLGPVVVLAVATVVIGLANVALLDAVLEPAAAALGGAR